MDYQLHITRCLMCRDLRWHRRIVFSWSLKRRMRNSISKTRGVFWNGHNRARYRLLSARNLFMKFIDRQSGRSAALILGGLLICLTCATACRQDMHDQPKLIPLREGSARPLVEGTVPRGSVRE